MLNVLSIIIVTGRGGDTITLELDLPSGEHPFEEKAKATMKVAAGQGERYVKVWFPDIPYDVVRMMPLSYQFGESHGK